jgi:hypothetical protein
VVDQTDLSGRYDFTLEWTPDPNGAVPSGSEVQPTWQGTTFLPRLVWLLEFPFVAVVISFRVTSICPPRSR